MQRTLAAIADRMARGGGPVPNGGAGSDEGVKELARGVNQLVTQMRAEQKVVREWVDEQAAQSNQVAALLKDLTANTPRRS